MSTPNSTATPRHRDTATPRHRDTEAVKRHRCPVCWEDVEPTRRRNVAEHFTGPSGPACPVGGEPFAIAQPYYPSLPTLSVVA